MSVNGSVTSIYSDMEKKNPVGRPQRLKHQVLELLIYYWLGTAIVGLLWLWLGGGEPAQGMLAVAGILWWLGAMIDLYWP